MAKATPQVSLVQEARNNLKNFEAEMSNDVYEALVEIIKDVSARGAIGLDVRHHSDYTAISAVTVRDTGSEIWHKDFADVDINIAPVVNHKEIAERLEADGFQVSYVTDSDYGKVIDVITWYAE